MNARVIDLLGTPRSLKGGQPQFHLKQQGPLREWLGHFWGHAVNPREEKPTAQASPHCNEHTGPKE
jgi:hypothetical protein